MSVALDSSLTLAWFFEDERSEAAVALLHRVAEEGAIVPTLWRFEIANGLEMAIRRKRIDLPFRDRAPANLEVLDIETDRDSDRLVWSTTVQMAGRHQLTVYDAVYLELAQRRRVPLATLDRALRRAADAVGVEWVGG